MIASSFSPSSPPVASILRCMRALGPKLSMMNCLLSLSIVFHCALGMASGSTTSSQGYSSSSSSSTIIKSLWTPTPGSFAGVPASTLGIDQPTLLQMYGPDALKRAKTWVKSQKTLWCGTAQEPDSEPAAGVFPFTPAPTNSTSWPGACPASAQAQALLDQGLAWRMLFNDNEAACAFRAAGRIDKACAMAFLGAALTMGPNVNYAFIISPFIYRDILQALADARTALATAAAQLPLAPILFTALQQRYCVDQPGQLDKALAQRPDVAFAAYNKRFKECGWAFTASVSALAEKYPEDPNIAAIAAGALMEQPAWKWWRVGSQTAGALARVTVDATPPSITSTADHHGASVSAAAEQQARQTSIGMTSGLVEPHAALANEILSRGLNTAPNHLGLLHYAIHNLEQGPEPSWAQSVADRLFTLGGASQGHAAHMRTHIDMRVGDYGWVITGNKRAIADDAQWDLARSGGGIMSVLYKYNPHNIAFIAEAAQHAGRWQDMSAAIAMLGYGAGLPLLADPSMASLVSYHTRQLLQPLRFGAYQAIVDGTGPGGACPIQGSGASTTLTVNLPGGISQKVTCGATCGDARLFARTVALARLGRASEADTELAALVQSACSDATVKAAKLGACAKPAATGGRRMQHAVSASNLAAVSSAEAVAQVYLGDMASTADSTLNLSSTHASGTLTINNGDALSALNLLVPAAEVAGASGQADTQLRLLRQAVQVQEQLQYDEPAPFFYPIAETLAGVLMKRGGAADLQEAAAALRQVLFQWPRSTAASLALAEVLTRSGGEKQAAATIQQIVSSATRLNDTVIELAWL